MIGVGVDVGAKVGVLVGCGTEFVPPPPPEQAARAMLTIANAIYGLTPDSFISPPWPS